jgi:hypothetical protein
MRASPTAARGLSRRTRPERVLAANGDSRSRHNEQDCPDAAAARSRIVHLSSLVACGDQTRIDSIRGALLAQQTTTKSGR